MIRDLAIDEIGERRWNGFVLSHPGGSVFHHSAWHRVMERTYGLKARYLAGFGKSGNLRCAVPYAMARGVFGAARLVSFPFSDYCGPLLEEPSDFEEMIGFIRSTIRPSSIELRSPLPLPGQQAGWTPYFNDIIRLDNGIEAAREGLHRDCVRRAIAKAGRDGVIVAESDGLEGMKAFYGLHQETRRRHGVPPQPFSFFRNLTETLTPPGMASTLFAVKDGRRVAGLITLRLGSKSFYKYGASSRECPRGANQLLLWKAIEREAGQGCVEFDLGRTAASNAGLLEYKARWGAARRQLHYLTEPDGAGRRGGGRLASSIFKRAPAFSNRIIGALLYKYMA